MFEAGGQGKFSIICLVVHVFLLRLRNLLKRLQAIARQNTKVVPRYLLYLSQRL